MKSLLPIDELNRIETKISSYFLTGKPTKEERDDLIDDMVDLFLLAYACGNESANTQLGTSVHASMDEVSESVYKEVAGKTWEQRVDEYLGFASSAEADAHRPSTVDGDGSASQTASKPTGTVSGTPADIIRIAETETHRIYNEGSYNTAQDTGLDVVKTWVTMLDEKVRDTHSYLEGVSVPLDADFITYDGDSAMMPGGFENAENNINCRCELQYELA